VVVITCDRQRRSDIIINTRFDIGLSKIAGVGQQVCHRAQSLGLGAQSCQGGRYHLFVIRSLCQVCTNDEQDLGIHTRRGILALFEAAA
jgi:hypothetical protein